MRKLLSAAIVLFIGYYLITQPDSAAAFVSQAASGIQGAAEGLSAFVNSLN